VQESAADLYVMVNPVSSTSSSHGSEASKPTVAPPKPQPQPSSSSQASDTVTLKSAGDNSNSR